MVSGSTSSTMEIATPASGSVARAMGSESRCAPMGAATLGSSSAGSSMALATTVSGMGIDMQENTLETKSMVLVYITFANGHCYEGSWHED
ncbi:hypothetical protein J5N97_009293 [Dioscorea zingiberensis]|uniref:Uncharacterized protein n=1 Tax=Dioscorea zingiberensis TaxID=325984 RepID=A0A9D5CZ12_9LILI|nr:hypothetical protein J5N97_009293 [Dioscorea zingiberensis]